MTEDLDEVYLEDPDATLEMLERCGCDKEIARWMTM